MGKKLPRKTISMAKRASAVAEDAADLDLVEEAIGSDEERPHDYKTIAVGFGGAVLFMLLTMMLVRVIFGSPDTNFSMLPDGYRESVGLVSAAEEVPNQRAELPSTLRTRSPFPEPATEQPIILDVDCPSGTVEIATGAGAADTVCVRGQVVQDAPTVNTGEYVPGATPCVEDEVYDQVSGTCIHVERNAPPASLPITGR